MRSLRHLPESVRHLTGGLASPVSSSTPDAKWSGGRVTGGSREAVWADTKRGHALSLGKKRCAVGSQVGLPVPAMTYLRLAQWTKGQRCCTENRRCYSWAPH